MLLSVLMDILRASISLQTCTLCNLYICFTTDKAVSEEGVYLVGVRDGNDQHFIVIATHLTGSRRFK